MTSTPHGLRILFTGSRDWRETGIVGRAILDAVGTYAPHLIEQDDYGPRLRWTEVTCVHGGARGLDSIAARIAKAWTMPTECYPARDFPSPRARNQHMVDRGADVCLAFATSWASGTGMCARMARRAGIHTIDYGVSTDVRADVTR